MPPVRLFALAVAFIIACPLGLLPVPGAGAGPAPAPVRAAAAPAPATVPPLGLGDWMVNASEVLEDRTVVLDGCLTVEQNGELTLSNATLIVKCAFDREHWIRVLAGGILNIVNGSTVAGFDPDYPFSFWVEPGAQVQFSDSMFVSAGLDVSFRDDKSVMGGIIIQSSLNDIKNCTFTGMPVALTILNTNCTLQNCTFDDDYVGALSNCANTTFLNCTFSSNTEGWIGFVTVGAGAWCWRSVSEFDECEFTENDVGIAVDNSTCTATDCSFSRNTLAGVYVSGYMSYETGLPDPALSGPCDTTVVDCTFKENTYGIARAIEGWLGTQPLHIVNCDFTNDTYLGIWWENRIVPDPYAKYQPPSWWPLEPHAVWNVTGPSSVTGDRMMFNGSIDIGPGGSLGLCRTVLRMDSGIPGEDGIEVRSGGKLSIAGGSMLTATKPDWPYRLACRPGSELRLEDSRLRDCGWNISVQNESGPFIETGNAEIRRSVVEACPAALVMNGAAKALVEGSRLSGSYLAVILDNSTLELRNSTAVSSGASSAALLNGSRLICLNSSLDRDLADLRDAASRLEVGWYLGILAVWSDGRPAAGASVAVRDALGTEVQNLSVDEAGRASDLVLWETFITAGDRTSYTPHRLDCRSGSLSNLTSVTMDRSRSLTVVLPDTEPPSVSFLAPAPGALLNSGRVEIAGTARDNLALESVELTVDGFERHTLYRDPGGSLSTLDWNLTVVLAEGAHTVVVAAADTSGNLVFESLSFSVDFTLPKIIILFPLEGTLTNVSEIAVSGIVEAGCRVSVNGVEARTFGPAFSATARLSEGLNLVTATAVDAAGNQNSTSTTVRLDTLPPRLEVTFTPDALYVNRPQVNLSGTMEFGSFVTVNGRAVVLPGLGANFTTQAFLVPGNNTISIRAMDAAGNVASVERRFVLDTVPPSFRVLFPPDGFQTKVQALAVSLLAEAGSDVSAGAVTVTVPGNPGDQVELTLNLTLAEGTNTILLRATDAAGNAFSVTREVLLDTQAPALAVSSPADGYHTSNFSVYVIGTTEPGATVTVNGEGAAVGQGGDFSVELTIQPGRNRIVVASADALGNVNSLTLNVTRVAGQASEDLRIGPGPDWLFWGFLIMAATGSALEGYWLAGRPRRPAPGRGPAEGGA